MFQNDDHIDVKKTELQFQLTTFKTIVVNQYVIASTCTHTKYACCKFSSSALPIVGTHSTDSQIFW